MQTGPHIAQVAALVGDPARAEMLAALMGSQAPTAAELAGRAGVTPQAASFHLARLAGAGLLAMEKQGRHRYHRLASPLVGRMPESVMAVAEAGPARYRPHWKGGEALRTARTCYDHLAGRLAVALADALLARGHVMWTEDGGEVTRPGLAALADVGVDAARIGGRRRAFCRPCLDWSERRPHLAGSVGALLATRAFELEWVTRTQHGRAVLITATGRRGFAETFGVRLDA